MSAARRAMRLLSARLARRVSALDYLRKWLVLGALLGVVAGLGAVAFYAALSLATHVLLEAIAGYHVPTPFGEGARLASAHAARPWLLPLVVASGGLISGFVVFRLAPEAEGHGTDAAIATVHENPRGARARAVVVKIFASAVTIGSGGSGGREGPTAQISAGFGSLLARVLDLSPADGRIAVSVGIGSGIGSIFGAPLGGALLSAELLYRDDVEIEALIPGFIASIVGYTVFSAFYGFEPLFGFAGSAYRFHEPIQLAWFVVIGVLCGLVGLAYAKGFYFGVEAFDRLRVSRMLKPALGGLLVGLVALAMPQVLGTGYGWIQRGLGRTLLSIPVWVVLLLPFAKILCTTLSIGSGGSGGIFGPGMVIGAFTGAAVWRLLAPIAPGVPHDPAGFVIVGMMACFGSIARAPLAVMLMVAEMTGSFEVLAPAMLAVGIATLIVRRFDETIYRSQLRSRSDQPGARLAVGLPLLASISVADSVGRPLLVLSAAEDALDARRMLEEDGLDGAPVVDENAVYVGVFDRSVDAVDIGERIAVGRIADPTTPSISVDADLEAGLETLIVAGRDWVPVLDDRKRVAGVLSTGDVIRAHQAAMRGRIGASTRAAMQRVRDESRGEDHRRSERSHRVDRAKAGLR